MYKTRGRVLSGGAADGKKDVGDKGGRRGGGEAGWDAVREGEGGGRRVLGDGPARGGKLFFHSFVF